MPISFPFTFRELSASIRKDTILAANGSDEENPGQFPDAELDAELQNSEEQNVFEQLPLAEVNVEVKNESDRADAQDQHHDDNAENASVGGGEKENEALLGRSQERAGGGNAHGKTITLPDHDDGRGAKTPEDGSKHIIHVDDDRDTGGSNGDSQRNVASEDPVQPTVRKTDTTHANDVNKDGRHLVEGETGTVAPKNNEQGKVPLDDTKNIPERHVLSDNKGSISQTERSRTSTTIHKKSEEIDGRDTISVELNPDTIPSGDNKRGPSAGQPKHTTHDPTKPDPHWNSKGRPDADVEFVTVIFHALLTPTFSVNFYQGEKIVLRGQPPFSWNAEKQVEIRVVRY